MTYLPRLADKQLQESLRMSGAVLIEGPRGCGKTMTARQSAKSVVNFDIDAYAVQAVQVNPHAILSGDRPRLLDEWQIAPAVWNQVRNNLDSDDAVGQFILTGSVTPPDDPNMHPGASRFSRMRMRPMTLQESGISNGAISVSRLLRGEEDYTRPQNDELPFRDLCKVMMRGGWPRYFNLTFEQASRMNKSYLNDLFRVDFQKLPGSNNPLMAQKVLRELARLTGSATPMARVAGQISKTSTPVKATTVQAYVEQLVRLHIVEEVPAWLPRTRSRYSVNQAPKRYLADPSLAIAALNSNMNKLETDLETTGFFFENLVMRDLLAIAESLHGNIFQYRDETGMEVDAVIESEDGAWGAFEIKLGFNATNDAAVSLREFANRVDTSVAGEPAFLAVITNSQYSYQRPDGVHVISVTGLGA